MHVFMNHCVTWFIGELIFSLLISYKWRGFPRIFCAVTCIIPVVMSNQPIVSIDMKEFSQVQEAQCIVIKVMDSNEINSKSKNFKI